MNKITTIGLEGFAFSVHKTDSKEENERIFAPKTLQEIYKSNHFKGRGKTENVMYFLPTIAKFYGVDKNNLLQSWIDEFGLLNMRGLR